MAKKTKKAPKALTTSAQYKAILDIAGQKYEGEGETIYDALSAIPLDFTQVKYKGTITVSQGECSYEKFYFMKPLRMIFLSKPRRTWVARQLGRFLEIKEKGLANMSG